MSPFSRISVASCSQWTPIVCGALMAIVASSTALAETASIDTSAKKEHRSFFVRIQAREDDTGAKVPFTEQEISRSVTAIEHRLGLLGFSEPRISKQGEDRLLIQLQDLTPDQATHIVTALQQVGKLGLREVSARNDEQGPDGKRLAQRVLDGDEIVPGYCAITLKGKDENGLEFKRPILVSRRMALGNSDIASAVPSPQQADAVAITLNEAGTDKMIALTQDMRPGLDRIAIVLNGEAISAPVVNQVPLGKHFIIEGLREPGEVQSLVVALMKPFEFPLTVEEQPTPPAQKDAK